MLKAMRLPLPQMRRAAALRSFGHLSSRIQRNLTMYGTNRSTLGPRPPRQTFWEAIVSLWRDLRGIR